MKLIDGTTCTACYGVFGESKDGNYEIGVRPLLFTSEDMSYVGFRVRAVPKKSNQDDNVVDIPGKDIATGLVKAFPGVPFNKVDDVRASFVGGLHFGIGAPHIKALHTLFTQSRYTGKLIKGLLGILEQVGGTPTEEDTVYKWLADQYEHMFNELEAHFGEAITEAKTPKLEYDPSNVVVPLFKTQYLGQQGTEDEEPDEPIGDPETAFDVDPEDDTVEETNKPSTE